MRFEKYFCKPAGKRDVAPRLKAHDRMQNEHSQAEQPKLRPERREIFWSGGRSFRYSAEGFDIFKANLGGTADFRPKAKVFLFAVKLYAVILLIDNATKGHIGRRTAWKTVLTWRR